MTDSQVSWRGLLTAALDYAVELFMVIAPQDKASMWLKCRLLRCRGARIGSRVKIWRDVWIDDYRKFAVGNDVTIGKSVMLVSVGGIEIGDRTMIGHGAKILSGGHRIPDSPGDPMRWSGPDASPITIEQDAWIGAGAIVLPGVCIGHGAVVAAGAVVVKAVPPYTVVGGIPAAIIRDRASPGDSAK